MMMMNTNGAATAENKIDEKLMKISPSNDKINNDGNAGTKKQIANIARTLTNSHPLMLSPTNTDSDVDEFQVIKNANFPDVIPLSEHQLDMSATTTTTNNHNHHNKMSLLRSHSPDLLSSESEADISPYHAAVEVNYQTVTLLSKHHYHYHHHHNNNNHNQNIQPNNNHNMLNNNNNLQQQQPNIQLQQQQQQQREDISSLDSISNHSFENEPNLASLSPSSSIMDIDALNDDHDDDDDNVDDDYEAENDDNNDDVKRNADCTLTKFSSTKDTNLSENHANISSLPQYSANEERRDVRNWQKITLPNGSTREIDMRVIEPYKRVLSHGGYLKAGGHNAIVLFSACYLPDRSRTDYSYVMDNLFLYVVKTLEQLVTEDYVLVYLHGGSDRRSVPPFPWLKKCYQLIDRRLRKSLKNLYLVHPTFWLKSIVWMTRPFISTKFWRKLIYVKSLEELGTHVAIEKAAIPEKVKQYDAKHC